MIWSKELVPTHPCNKHALYPPLTASWMLNRPGLSRRTLALRILKLGVFGPMRGFYEVGRAGSVFCAKSWHGARDISRSTFFCGLPEQHDHFHRILSDIRTPVQALWRAVCAHRGAVCQCEGRATFFAKEPRWSDPPSKLSISMTIEALELQSENG